MLAVTTFKTMDEALELANDTQYGLAQVSGAATVIWPIRWGAAYRLGACGPTAITLTRHMLRLVATNNQVSVAKPTR